MRCLLWEVPRSVTNGTVKETRFPWFELVILSFEYDRASHGYIVILSLEYDRASHGYIVILSLEYHRASHGYIVILSLEYYCASHGTNSKGKLANRCVLLVLGWWVGDGLII